MKLSEIARKVNQEGDNFIKNHGTKMFHEFAAETLSQYSFKDLYNFEEVSQFLFSSDSPQIQNFKALEFSDLPVTLSRGESCFIDLYFWRRRPTTIHNHHFSGAFVGLLGKNVDLEFTFASERKVGEFHEMGEITLKKEMVIGPGDIHPIAPLNGFIHQNHHQADLTVNLCFRTNEIKDQSLSNYLYSGLRYTKNSELMVRSSQLRRLIDIGSINVSSLNLNLDDAISFLLLNYGIESGNPAFRHAINFCQEKVINEGCLNIAKLLELHEQKCSELEENYE